MHEGVEVKNICRENLIFTYNKSNLEPPEMSITIIRFFSHSSDSLINYHEKLQDVDLKKQFVLFTSTKK
jgi:hypothetical protein